MITRALGTEGTVDVDTRSFRARPGDVYLLCSDGLTTMVSEEQIASLLLANHRLRDAGEALIAAANEAGGRDNITVVLVRLEEVLPGQPPPAPSNSPRWCDAPAAPPDGRRRRPRTPRPALQAGGPTTGRSRRRLRAAGTLAVLLIVLGLIGAGAYLALQSVYFIGTNDRGLVTHLPRASPSSCRRA